MKKLKNHTWAICGGCGPMVVCKTCGNNCCNGGYGEVDDKTCTDCPSAYEKQNGLPPKWMRPVVTVHVGFDSRPNKHLRKWFTRKERRYKMRMREGSLNFLTEMYV